MHAPSIRLLVASVILLGGACMGTGGGTGTSSGFPGGGSSGSSGTSGTSGTTGNPTVGQAVWVDGSGAVLGDYVVMAETQGFTHEGVNTLRDAGGTFFSVGEQDGAIRGMPVESTWVFGTSDCTGTRWLGVEDVRPRWAMDVYDGVNSTYLALNDDAQPEAGPGSRYVRDLFTGSCIADTSSITLFAESSTHAVTVPSMATPLLHVEMRNPAMFESWVDAQGANLGPYLPIVDTIGSTQSPEPAIVDNNGIIWRVDPAGGTVGPFSRTAAWVYESGDCTGTRFLSVEYVQPRWAFQVPDGSGSVTLADGAVRQSPTVASYASFGSGCTAGSFSSSYSSIFAESDVRPVTAFSSNAAAPLHVEASSLGTSRVWKDAAGTRAGGYLSLVEQWGTFESVFGLVDDAGNTWRVDMATATVSPVGASNTWVFASTDCSGPALLAVDTVQPRWVFQAEDPMTRELKNWAVPDNATQSNAAVQSYLDYFSGSCIQGSQSADLLFEVAQLRQVTSVPSGFAAPMHVE